MPAGFFSFPAAGFARSRGERQHGHVSKGAPKRFGYFRMYLTWGSKTGSLGASQGTKGRIRVRPVTSGTQRRRPTLEMTPISTNLQSLHSGWHVFRCCLFIGSVHFGGGGKKCRSVVLLDCSHFTVVGMFSVFVNWFCSCVLSSFFSSLAGGSTNSQVFCTPTEGPGQLLHKKGPTGMPHRRQPRGAPGRAPTGGILREVHTEMS